MKLVRINENIIFDNDDVQFAIWNKERGRVEIGFKSNNNSVTTTNKKVLDAICGSEEHRKSNAFIDEKGHLHNSHFKTNS